MSPFIPTNREAFVENRAVLSGALSEGAVRKLWCYRVSKRLVKYSFWEGSDLHLPARDIQMTSKPKRGCLSSFHPLLLTSPSSFETQKKYIITSCIRFPIAWHNYCGKNSKCIFQSLMFHHIKKPSPFMNMVSLVAIMITLKQSKNHEHQYSFSLQAGEVRARSWEVTKELANLELKPIVLFSFSPNISLNDSTHQKHKNKHMKVSQEK